jgi:hypothetical protein
MQLKRKLLSLVLGLMILFGGIIFAQSEPVAMQCRNVSDKCADTGGCAALVWWTTCHIQCTTISDFNCGTLGNQ